MRAIFVFLFCFLPAYLYAQTPTAMLQWNAVTPVTSGTYALPGVPAAYNVSALAYANGANAAFTFSVLVNGKAVAGCNGIVVTSQNITSKCSSTGTGIIVPSGAAVTVQVTNVKGTPVSSLIVITFMKSAS